MLSKRILLFMFVVVSYLCVGHHCQMGQPGFGNEGFGAHQWNEQAWAGNPQFQQHQQQQQYPGDPENPNKMGSYFMGGGQQPQGGMPQGMPAGGPIPTLQGPPQSMFQQVQSMYQQRLAAGQCMDNPMFGDQCEMYAGMGYCTPAYSHANSHNPQVQQQLQWIYENCPESCGLCLEAEV